jgi:hypothetical protein
VVPDVGDARDTDPGTEIDGDTEGTLLPTTLVTGVNGVCPTGAAPVPVGTEDGRESDEGDLEVSGTDRRDSPETGAVVGLDGGVVGEAGLLKVGSWPTGAALPVLIGLDTGPEFDGTETGGVGSVPEFNGLDAGGFDTDPEFNGLEADRTDTESDGDPVFAVVGNCPTGLADPTPFGGVI